jgi:hypothetical protein
MVLAAALAGSVAGSGASAEKGAADGSPKKWPDVSGVVIDFLREYRTREYLSE